MGNSEHKGVPSDLLPYLASDEKLVQTERTKEWKIYFTNKRFILKKGGLLKKEMVEASYQHISSIEYRKVVPINWIIAGIICIASSFAMTYIFSSFQNFWFNIPQIFLAIAGIVIIVAAFLRPAKFIIHIVGRNPITLSGDLEEIFKTAREQQNHNHSRI